MSKTVKIIIFVVLLFIAIFVIAIANGGSLIGRTAADAGQKRTVQNVFG